MSRPPIHKYDYYTENPRCSGLKPFIQTIINRIQKKEDLPTTDIKPIVNKQEFDHLSVCATHLKNYIDCRTVNSEYNCEPYREFILKLKCI